jgi:hypothetical protein
MFPVSHLPVFPGLSQRALHVSFDVALPFVREMDLTQVVRDFAAVMLRSKSGFPRFDKAFQYLSVWNNWYRAVSGIVELTQILEGKLA